MIPKLLFSIALLANFAIVPAPAAAHHGSQGYDFSGPRKTLKGTVTRYAWANPHAQLYLDVKDDKGNIVNWVMELNNPGNLVGLGWTHSSIKAGDVVTVTFNAGLNGKPIGICTDVVFADGRKLHSSQGCTDTNQGTFDKLYPQGSK